MESLPYSHTHGVQDKTDFDSVFWAIRYVFNILHLKFSYMMSDVKAEQKEWEQKGLSVQQAVDDIGRSGVLTPKVLTELYSMHAEQSTAHWWKLFHKLMFKFADGYINVPNLSTSVGYPAWWLRTVGYSNGPPPVPSSSVAMKYAYKKNKKN